MSKPKRQIPKALEFIQFWLFIAQQLGSSRLKLNPRARDVHDLFDRNNDSKGYLKQIILDSYKRSRCHSLYSQISIDVVLDLLGETAYQLRNNHLDDLFDIELLEEIAWHISDRYKHYLHIETTSSDQSTGQLISFPQYKIRIANTRL